MESKKLRKRGKARDWLRDEANIRNYKGLDAEALAFLEKFNDETVEGEFTENSLLLDKKTEIYAEQYANRQDILNHANPLLAEDTATGSEDALIEVLDRHRRESRIRARNHEGYPKEVKKVSKISPLPNETTPTGVRKKPILKGRKEYE